MTNFQSLLIIHAKMPLFAGNSAFICLHALSAFRAVGFCVDKQNQIWLLADDAVMLCACSVTVCDQTHMFLLCGRLAVTVASGGAYLMTKLFEYW
jgi:hypothetical protein